MSIPLQKLTESLASAWVENTRKVKGGSRRKGPRDYLTASGLSECGRAMALDLLHPEDAPPFGDDVLERFYRGDEIETVKNARLHQVGLLSQPPFRVHGQQREIEIYDRSGEMLLIRGKVEGTLEFYTERISVDYEIKSGEAVRNVETLEDMMRSPWTRKYLRQFLAYLYAQVEGKRGNGCGVFILDRPGLPVFIPLDLAADDQLLEIAERTLTLAEAAVRARRGLEDLPPFSVDPGPCQKCYHLGKSCHPPMDLGPGAEVDDDEVAQEALETFYTTKEAALDHERAKRFLFGDSSKPGRYRGRPTILAGKFLVQGKWKPHTGYVIPEAKKSEFKVTNPKGAWSPEVVEIVSTAKD